MWYWDILPLAIEMVGLPHFVTFKLFHDIFPSRIVHPSTHHIFALCLATWLLTFGPNFFGKIFAKSEKKKIKVKSE